MRVKYTVKARKDSPVCDVHLTEEGGRPRLVNTFNSEAEAWEWITEQEQAAQICERLESSRHLRR